MAVALLSFFALLLAAEAAVIDLNSDNFDQVHAWKPLGSLLNQGNTTNLNFSFSEFP